MPFSFSFSSFRFIVSRIVSRIVTKCRYHWCNMVSNLIVLLKTTFFLFVTNKAANNQRETYYGTAYDQSDLTSSKATAATTSLPIYI